MPSKTRFVQLQQIFCLLLMMAQYASAVRCRWTDGFPNGRARPRMNILRFQCNSGYTLIGNHILTCDWFGRINGDRPLCASKYSALQETKEENIDLNYKCEQVESDIKHVYKSV